MVPVHVQPPPLAAGTQVTALKPNPSKGLAIPSQLTLVPDRFKHPDGSSACVVPDVVVLSVYVPSALAVHVPLTVTVPVSFTFMHIAGSSPAAEMSRFVALKVKHDELTFHVPTTLPPQAATFEHADPPPVPVLPDAPAPPLELPPVPEGLTEPPEHAPASIPAAIAIVRNADRSCMERSPSRGNLRRSGLLISGDISFSVIATGRPIPGNARADHIGPSIATRALHRATTGTRADVISTLTFAARSPRLSQNRPLPGKARFAAGLPAASTGAPLPEPPAASTLTH
jgi:hypothetical protein